MDQIDDDGRTDDAQNPPGQQRRGRVAVIEDGEATRHFLVHSLRSQGYHVKGIEDGASALPLLRLHQPDIILLDVALPGLTGFDVCRQIRADPILQQAIVILLTGRASSADRMAGWSAGADDYLIKPCDLNEVLARVAAHLRHRATVAPHWHHPITQLPAPAALEDNLLARIRHGESFAACYADIAHFTSYNQRYGYLAGDTMLAVVADLLRAIVNELNDLAQERRVPERSLAGHLGGDDFLLITSPAQALEAGALLAKRFSALVPQLYQSVDRARGWVPGLDHNGITQRFPLATLNIATVVRHPADIILTTDGHALASIATDLWHHLRTLAKTPPKLRQTG